MAGKTRGRGGKSSEADLVKNGWKRQFIASGPRLEEAIAVYREMGLDVRLEPVDKNDPSICCTECFDPKNDRLIYTRKKPAVKKRG